MPDGAADFDMIKKLHYKVRGLPTPLAGLALGIASLGWCLENALPLHGWGQLTGAGIASTLLVFLSIRFAAHADTLWDDLQHPVVGSIVPTFAMTLMVISASIGRIDANAGTAVWLFAIFLHLTAFFIFSYWRMNDPKLDLMVPSWFVPPIGIVVACVSFPNAWALLPLASALFWFGLGAYAIMLPLMIYRLIFLNEVPNAAKPTIAIMAAPASLLLAGYLTIEQNPSFLLCSLLFGIAVLMTFVIYFSFWRLMRLQFSPGYAAFTFPMAIGATALFKLADRLQYYPGCLEYCEQIRWLASFELAVAAAVIGYVAVLYALNIRKFLPETIPAERQGETDDAQVRQIKLQQS